MSDGQVSGSKEADDLPRRIWLCADDYGLGPGVNRAIRNLVERGRLNATSVMVVGPAAGRDEINSLQTAAAASPRCAIGLHATLTAPFRPLTMHFGRSMAACSCRCRGRCALACFAGSIRRSFTPNWRCNSRPFANYSAGRRISSTVTSMCSYFPEYATRFWLP